MQWQYFLMNLEGMLKRVSTDKFFTPEIWTDLMYKLVDVDYTSKVLDAACGSGTFFN